MDPDWIQATFPPACHIRTLSQGSGTKRCRRRERMLEEKSMDNDVESTHPDRAKESSLQLDNKLFLFDSVCTNFHVQVFLEQILSHLILPFAPFFTNMRAQGFLNLHFAQILFNYVIPSSVYLMIIAYVLSSDKQLGVLVGAIWVPLLFFVQHRLTVALKYASLSVTEYRKFHNCTDIAVAQKYVAQIELLRNWSSREEELIEFELGCASVRTATKLNEMFFILHNPDNDPSSWNSMLHWNEFIIGDLLTKNENKLQTENSNSTLSPFSHEEVNTNKNAKFAWHNSFFRRQDGSYCISVHDACKFVILRSDCPPTVLYFLNIGGFLVICLVTIFPFIQILQRPVDRSLWVTIFLVVSTFLNALMGMVYVLLLTVVIKDAVRHVHITQFLHSLIRLTDLRLQLHFTFWSPWSMTNSSSIQNVQLQQREEAIARKNYQLIRSLTVQYSPEESYNRLLSDYYLESRPTISQSFSSMSSKTTDIKNRQLLLHQFSKKKSTMVGEFLTTGDAALDAEERPSTILPDVNVDSSSEIELSNSYYSSSKAFSEKRSKFRRSSKNLNVFKNRRPLAPSIRSDSRTPAGLISQTRNPTDDKSYPTGRETNAKVDDLLENAYSKLPRIDLNLPENVSAWIACRLALQHFGDRFRMRKEIYIAGNSLVILGFMVSVLVLTFSGTALQRNVFSSVFVIQACLLIALSFVYIILLATFFSLSNAELAQHQHTLSSHTLRMRNEIAHMQELRQRWRDEKHICSRTEASGAHDSDDEEEATRQHLLMEIARLEANIASIERSIEQVTDALERIESSLEIAALHTELKQQQLYGFNVDSSLVFSLLTTAVTFFILILGMYSNGVADAENSVI